MPRIAPRIPRADVVGSLLRPQHLLDARSAWREGRLSNYDTLLLEYDTPRAGDFSPLAHVRPDQTVVPGLITTKDGQLEDPALVETRISEAAAYVPLERLALSPQCGFASGEYATTMTHAEQAAKLRLVGQVADKVWGGT